MTSFTLVIDFVKIGLGIGYSTKEFIEESLAKKDVYILDEKLELLILKKIYLVFVQEN